MYERGQAHLNDVLSYYNGDMTEPQVLPTALTDGQLRTLAAQPIPHKPETVLVDLINQPGLGLRFWQNGPYTLRDQAGRNTPLPITGISPPLVLSGPWQVRFPPDRGHQPKSPCPNWLPYTRPSGCPVFSGTATYTRMIDVPAALLAPRQRVYLDLGRVEVLANVVVNGKDLSTLWTRPYRIDITDAIKAGANSLEIRATSLWPNRLIGDEQLPDPDQFTPGGGASGFASLSQGAMIALPDWYKQGIPKPADGRVTFTTRKHYTKASPLLESGLIGPVVLRVAAII